MQVAGCALLAEGMNNDIDGLTQNLDPTIALNDGGVVGLRASPDFENATGNFKRILGSRNSPTGIRRSH